MHQALMSTARLDIVRQRTGAFGSGILAATMHVSPSSFALFLAVLLLGGCEQKSGAEKGTGATTSGAATSSTAAIASPKASGAVTGATPDNTAAQIADPPPYAAKKVAEGSIDKTSAWTLAFEVERKSGNADLDYEAAQKSCQSSGKWLCSDAQWERACKQDSALGKLETWTGTGVGGQRFVVRGGTDCSTRKIVSGSETSGTRVAACCDRAIAIETNNRNLAFLRASAMKLRQYEKALQERDSAALADVYEDKVTFLGKELGRRKLLRHHQADFQKHAKQWTYFDGCTVKIGKDGEEATLVSDCRTVFKREAKVLVAVQRLVRGGPKGLIVQIGKTSLKKTPALGGIFAGYDGEPETTERVGVLLLSE